MSLSRAAIVDQLKEIVGADRVITDETVLKKNSICLLYTSPSPRDQRGSRMPSSA